MEDDAEYQKTLIFKNKEKLKKMMEDWRGDQKKRIFKNKKMQNFFMENLKKYLTSYLIYDIIYIDKEQQPKKNERKENIMKLQKEFDYVKKQFAENLEKIKDYAPQLKASGQYKDFEIRLTWDCLRAFVGSGTICLWYEKYNCHDTHITTLGKKALKELKVI